MKLLCRTVVVLALTLAAVVEARTDTEVDPEPVQPASSNPTPCRVCSWHLTCQQLCENAEDECQGPWVEDTASATCAITYPVPALAAHARGRMVVANLTYIVHKDVLSDMISRLAHVKRIKLQGSPDGATGFGPLEQLGVLYSISLCFPRITMAWRYLNGQPLAPAGSCCHQECHWEELFKSAQTPTLRDILSKSVDASEEMLAGTGGCYHLPPVAPVNHSTVRAFRSDADATQPVVEAGQSRGAARRRVGTFRQSQDLMLPGLERLRQAWKTFKEQRSLGSAGLQAEEIQTLLAWLLVPSMIIALEGMKLASQHPLVALYICSIAVLRSAAEWRAVYMIASRRVSLRDALVCGVSGCMLMAVAVVMLTGFVTSWLPLLAAPMSTYILWWHMLTMPAVAAACVYGMYGAAFLRSQHQESGSHGAGAQALLDGGGGINGGRTEQGQSPQLQGQGLPAGAGQQGGAAGQLQRRNTRDAGAAGGTAGAGANGDVRRVVAIDPAQRALSETMIRLGVVDTRYLPEEILLQLSPQVQQMAAARGSPGGANAAAGPGPAPAAGAGNRRPGAQGAGAAAGGAAGGNAAAAAHAPAAAAGRGQGDPVSAAEALAARQTAAAAALAAIHWPPPLDVPAWIEEQCAVPDAFRCPITLSIMREPTQASSGVTYERHAIFQWLHIHRVDPVTHVPLKRHRLTPNLNLRQMIEDWAGKCISERAAAEAAAAQKVDSEAAGKSSKADGLGLDDAAGAGEGAEMAGAGGRGAHADLAMSSDMEGGAGDVPAAVRALGDHSAFSDTDGETVAPLGTLEPPSSTAVNTRPPSDNGYGSTPRHE